MKRLIFWDHERGTWQYDVFCLMIVAFIFLTPKVWFDNGDKPANESAPSAVQSPDHPSRYFRDGPPPTIGADNVPPHGEAPCSDLPS